VDVTVGIDIGTTSVKAVAATADGTVVARARVPHSLHAAHAGELAHDAAEAWHDGVLSALHAVASSDDVDVAAVQVAAMVPSLCAVDGTGRPISDGLLYGDERGAGEGGSANPSESGELVRFLGSLVRSHPDAAGYWPAQAVANHALCGIGAIDSVAAMTTLPLFDFTSWDEAVAGDAGLSDVGRLPLIGHGTGAIGEVQPAAGAAQGALVGPGTIDAYGEQLVAGADQVGDVLVILGSTLIVWAVVAEWVEVDGLWTVPHTAPGKVLVGGPSNAGGLFVNWAGRLLDGGDIRASAGETGADGRPADVRPDRVPVWQPYLRGERVPLHDPSRRASLSGLDIGMGPAAARRAALEASGFAARHMLDLAGLLDGEGRARRIVATGGGVQNAAWLAALADATGLPVDRVVVPEGGALGAAYLARLTAGLEASTESAGRWAAIAGRTEPDERWAAAAGERYERYRAAAAS
jgi:xylulokinase